MLHMEYVRNHYPERHILPKHIFFILRTKQNGEKYTKLYYNSVDQDILKMKNSQTFVELLIYNKYQT